jgi:DNA-binding response OmpR family regulator
MRALVVDDSAMIVELISHTLRKAGFEVASARNGADGLAAFQLGDFDIVLTDITMPECDGIEMTEKIRAVSPEVPIVMVTAADEPEYMARARQAGATAYLLKPIDGIALQATVEELVMFHHLTSG